MQAEPGRILAIDPGDRRIGVAISDPTQTIASPIGVIQSQSINKNALSILEIAGEHGVVLIVIGQPLHWDGVVSEQAKESIKLADLVQELGSFPVKLVDEYGTTQAAKDARLKMQVNKEKRSGHLDDLAATILLQNYLDSLDQGMES